MSETNPEIVAVRNTKAATNLNVEAAVAIINSSRIDRIILFATSLNAEGMFCHAEDGPETNLPLVAALAECRLPATPPLYVVFDGMFLTARRAGRDDEVRYMLDAAVASGKASFSTARAPFTSTLGASEAARQLLVVAERPTPLTQDTREVFWAMLR